MDSIYQLKTGEFVDLDEIAKIENLVDKVSKIDRFCFTIVFKHSEAPNEIIVSPALAMDEIKEAYHNMAYTIRKDYNPHFRLIFQDTFDQACDAGKNAYKKFAEEVRSDLVSAWRKFKKEKA
jgi:hypothetical protein